MERPKNVDGDAQHAAFRIDLLDDAVLAFEGTIGHTHGVTEIEGDLGHCALVFVAHLGQHGLHFLGAHRDRMILGAGEVEHAVGFLDEIPGLFHQTIVLVEEVAVGDDVAGEELAVAFRALSLFDFSHALHRHQNLEDIITHLLFLNAAEHAVTDLLFKAGADVDDKPLVARCGDSSHKNSEKRGVGGKRRIMRPASARPQRPT